MNAQDALVLVLTAFAVGIVLGLVAELTRVRG